LERLSPACTVTEYGFGHRVKDVELIVYGTDTIDVTEGKRYTLSVSSGRSSAVYNHLLTKLKAKVVYVEAEALNLSFKLLYFGEGYLFCCLNLFFAKKLGALLL